MPFFDPKELTEWSGGAWHPAEPKAIEGVSNDSRTIKRGNLYFALRGKNFDGHEFVGEAFDKGAGGAVIDRGQRSEVRGQNKSQIANQKSEMGCPLLLVDDPAKALHDIASAYRLKIAPEIVAIAGSVGKSTTKEMIAEILSITVPTARTRGNWNNDIGLSLSLLAMEADSCIGVFELGTNHPGEIAPLCDMLKPLWGVITNVGPAHIGYFDSVEAIANEKSYLLKNLPPDGVAVLSLDDRFFDLFCSVSPCRKITVSLKGDADYVCLSRDRKKKEAVIKEKSTGEEFILKLQLPGEYNVINAMFAIAVTRDHGVEWKQIHIALNSYTALPMRWQEENIGRIKVINDAYNANPMSMRASIQTFNEEMIGAKKWLVLAGMLELGRKEKEEHLALGEFVGKSDWTGLIVVGPLGELIAQGAEDTGFGRNHVFRCRNNSEAVRVLVENIAECDAVFLKASRGMRLEEIVENLKKQEKD